jgi:thioredoxin-like negative regulator of GroEL
LVEAALRRHDTVAMATWGTRLGLGNDSGDALCSARALIEAEEPEAAERLLEAALARAPDTVELLAELAHLRFTDGRTAEARAQVEEALARAVAVSDKARLHRLLAEVADHEGNPNRAAHERVLAARLEGH